MPDGDGVLVLDTMVISALCSVARRGIDLERPTDQRVAHLLRWLHRRPSVAVFHAFGIAEGAGFHRGALDHHALVGRIASSLAVVEHGRLHGEDWISSGEPVPDRQAPSHLVHPRNVTEAVEDLLPLTVLPCYLAALAAAAADRREQQPLEAATSVFRRLVAEIDYVPLFGWTAAALLFLGTPDLRRKLRQSLFKLQRPDLRLSCLSAAWDLGYLQLLSLIRSPALSELFEGRTPILVTEDRQLAPTAILATCLSNSPLFEIGADLLDPAWEGEALDLLHACSAERLVGGAVPDWESTAAAAARLERELGIEAPPLAVTAPTLVVKLGREELREFVDLLRFDDVGEIMDTYDRLGEKVELAGTEVVVGLLGDNARARGRPIEESFAAILAEPLWEARPRSSIFIAVLNMVGACIGEDSETMSAWGQKLVVERHEAWIWACLWWMGRKVLEDTAAARETSYEELVGRLLANFDAGVPAA